MNKIGNWIIHELKDGTTLTFETTVLEPDWRDSFAIRLVKIENKKGLRKLFSFVLLQRLKVLSAYRKSIPMCLFLQQV